MSLEGIIFGANIAVMKVKSLYNWFWTACTLAVACGCSSVSEEQKVVNEWIGKTVSIPDQLVFKVQEQPVDLFAATPDFRIINFVDSTGCTSCKLKLLSWDKLMKELKMLDDVDVEVLTIVSTRDSRDLQYLLQRDNFSYPVAIDTADIFNRTNILPSGAIFQTFLLDSEGEVIAIGNPLMNPKIKNLYKKIIQGDSAAESADHPAEGNHLIVEPSQSLGVLERGIPTTVEFAIINNTDETYTVQEIIPSCDCISASCTSPTLHPGESATLTLSFTTDSIAGPFKKYADLFFNEKNTPERATFFGYIK